MGHPRIIYFKRRQNPTMQAEYFPNLRKGGEGWDTRISKVHAVSSVRCMLEIDPNHQQLTTGHMAATGLSSRSRVLLRLRAWDGLDPDGI
jgi:hypothetical protein